jgi:retron-type reverse transcriptase
MNRNEESDPTVLASKPTNKAGRPVAEPVERRVGTKGNANQHNTRRAQNRESVTQALDRVRQAARTRKKERFTALLHHVDVDLLRTAFLALQRDAAPGVDGLTWWDYEADLEPRLAALHDRVQRGAYRPQPSRRTYIPKADGKQRPLAIAALEDKIVQGATAMVLNAIYEEDFLGFSYGFRPGRGAHDALDALDVGINSRKVSYILDADIRSFFDTVNIYLHYVLDLWANRWRQREATGDMIIVRYADDVVAGFEHEDDARRFLDAMRARFEEFALSLHPDKTRLIEFGRHAAVRRERRGLGKPETFNFLGFTFICGKSLKGHFLLHRKSRGDRMRAKLQEIQEELRQRRHQAIPLQGEWLRSVVSGYFNYHAVPTNGRALTVFHYHIRRLWLRTLQRRSERDGSTWQRIEKLAADWLPKPRILHPWPRERFAVRHPR